MWLWEEFQVHLEGNGKWKKCCLWAQIHGRRKTSMRSDTSKVVELAQLPSTIIQRRIKGMFFFTSKLQCSEDISIKAIPVLYNLSLYLFFFPAKSCRLKVVCSYGLLWHAKMDSNAPFSSEMSCVQFVLKTQVDTGSILFFCLKRTHKTREILVTAQLKHVSGPMKGAHCRALRRHHFRIKIFHVILVCLVKVQAQ